MMTSPSSRVRESAEFICSRAEHVRIEESGIEKSADIIASQLLSLSRGDSKGPRGDLDPRGSEQERTDWIFVRDAINFCFFTPAGLYRVRYKGREYTGYMAMCAALSRAVDSGTLFFRPPFCAQVSNSALGALLVGEDGDIPLCKERAEILREIGGILIESDISFLDLVGSCEGSSQRLVSSVLEKFPSFRDESLSAHDTSRRVYFYKRAQILVADLWEHFDGRGPGTFRDIGDLTMFPDYRVPQVLFYMGALSYSQVLIEILRQGNLVVKDGQLEHELRAASVWTVELLKDRVVRRLGEGGLEKARGNGWEVTAMSLDFFLWDFSKREREKVDACVPHHRTLSTFY